MKPTDPNDQPAIPNGAGNGAATETETAEETFKIESGVPLPERHRKWPWAKMKVGDSFFSPGTDKERGYAVSAASAFGRSDAGQGWKFVSKIVEENGVKGFRVWRLS